MSDRSTFYRATPQLSTHNTYDNAQINAVGTARSLASASNIFVHPAFFKWLEGDLMPTFDGKDKKQWVSFHKKWPAWWERQGIPEAEKVVELMSAWNDHLNGHMDNLMRTHSGTLTHEEIVDYVAYHFG